MNRRAFFRGIAAAAATAYVNPLPAELVPPSIFGDGSDGDVLLLPGSTAMLTRPGSFGRIEVACGADFNRWANGQLIRAHCVVFR